MLTVNPLLPVIGGLVLTSLACSTRAPATAGGVRANELAAEAVVAADDYPIIVRLVGRHQTITVTSGPTAPLYTAARHDGTVIVAAATLERLRREHPGIYKQLIPTIASTSDEAARPGRGVTKEAPLQASDLVSPSMRGHLGRTHAGRGIQWAGRAD